MNIYTKEDLIKKLKEIVNSGWIQNRRAGNSGGIGNTLEDLLGIEENNLPLPNVNEWELKAQRLNTSSLITLFHAEPSPRALKFIPQILLPNFGWKHKQAGKKYSENEKSFRQTINGKSASDRGFKVSIDRTNTKVTVSFDHTKVAERHKNWLNSVERKIGLKQLNPQPYWGFDDLNHKAGTKLLNCFDVQAKVKKEKRIEFYRYVKVQMLQKFKFQGFLDAIEQSDILIDFDARTGHNHGTKFRMRQKRLPELYETVKEII